MTRLTDSTWVRVTNNNLETINVVDANGVTFRIQPGESMQVLVKTMREGGVKLPMPKAWRNGLQSGYTNMAADPLAKGSFGSNDTKQWLQDQAAKPTPPPKRGATIYGQDKGEVIGKALGADKR